MSRVESVIADHSLPLGWALIAWAGLGAWLRLHGMEVLIGTSAVVGAAANVAGMWVKYRESDARRRLAEAELARMGEPRRRRRGADGE